MEKGTNCDHWMMRRRCVDMMMGGWGVYLSVHVGPPSAGRPLDFEAGPAEWQNFRSSEQVLIPKDFVPVTSAWALRELLRRARVRLHALQPRVRVGYQRRRSWTGGSRLCRAVRKHLHTQTASLCTSLTATLHNIGLEQEGCQQCHATARQYHRTLYAACT